jgi:flagellar FliJ protein
MKRFEFPLEVVLEKRKRDEDAIKLELSLKNKEINEAKRKMVDLKNQLQEMQAGQKKERLGCLTIVALKYSVSFRNKIKLDMMATDDHIQELYAQLAVIKQRLIKAKQRKRAIELIKERRFEEWQKEYKRKEQVFIDDISQQRYNRARNKKKHQSPVV